MPPTSRRNVILHCMLVGQNFDRHDFRKQDLRGYNFTNASLRGADFSYADLRGTTFVMADLSRACLLGVDAEGADFSAADLTGAYMRGANFSNTRMWFSHLIRMTAKNSFFMGADMQGANFAFGFFLGSMFGPPLANTAGARNLDKAVFEWYWKPEGGTPSYDPRPGYYKVTSSPLGGLSLRENSGRYFGGHDE